MAHPTVFIVDDEPKTRRSFSALISSLGLSVELFASGEELLSKVTATQPGCALVDFRLQGMDGIQLHRQLLRAGYHLPVILISAYLNVQTTAGALEQGVFRVLEKPYQHDQLATAVREALEYDRTLRTQKMYRLDFGHRLESLDARERLTLEMIVAGATNKAVERRLGLSTRTVDRIRASILEKMKFLSFVELSAAYGAVGKIGYAQTSLETERSPMRDRFSLPAPLAEDTADLQWLRCDLHDGAAQYLTAALMRLQTIEARHEITEDVRPHLHETTTLLSTAVAEIRDIIAGQSSGLPPGGGLVPAMKDLLNRMARLHGIEVGFVDNTQGGDIPPLVESGAYRILQECLTNAIRHSGSKRLRVELVRQAHTLRLEFRDWGCGFNMDTVGASHRGLWGIRRRAELLGGTAAIQSERGKGTEVKVELPLTPPLR